MYPYLLDGRLMSGPEIERASGIKRKRIDMAIERAKPTTMAELRAAVREDLEKPVRRRVSGAMYVWNNSANSPSRAAKVKAGTK